MSSSVGMMKFPIYGKIKFMFQTTNQFIVDLRENLPNITNQCHRERHNPVMFQSPPTRSHLVTYLISLLESQEMSPRLLIDADRCPMKNGLLIDSHLVLLVFLMKSISLPCFSELLTYMFTYFPHKVHEFTMFLGQISIPLLHRSLFARLHSGFHIAQQVQQFRSGTHA